MRGFVYALGFIIAFVSAAVADTTALPGIIREPMSLAVVLPDDRHISLDSLVVRPDRPGRFPLVVMVHGSPNSEPGKYLETQFRWRPGRIHARESMQ
jgi:hypothetical protein